MSPPRRPLLGAAVAVAALLLGLATGDSLVAGLAGGFGAALGLLIGWSELFAPSPRAPASAGGAAADRRAGDIIESIVEPVLLVREGFVATANPAARTLLGERIEGQDVRLVLRQPAVLERLASATTEACEPIEVVGIGDFGRPWLVTVAPIAGGDRIVHLSDRSETAAAERMRVDFVANASHELRTPLAAVLGLVETLQDDSAGGETEIRTRFLGLMHGEAKRMQHLIEDLMSLSRIEAERFNLPRDPVDLVGIVEEVRSGCAHLLDERSNTLAVDVRTDSTWVPGDRGQLLQLIRNLVVNAVKYGSPRTPVTVLIEDESPQAIRISVADRGEGIAVEHLPRLTERFYRVDAGRSRAVGGTGLGLAIVKHIVSRHRGRLDIRSKVGEGTTVLVSLPRAPEPQSSPLS
jgi:two-component system phosphate regulon sensor histidine kinase PhoR